MIRFQRCPVKLCGGPRRMGHLLCGKCWGRLPRGLRDRIIEELHNCRESRIAHSQELHALRGEAIELLSSANRERYAKPQGEQLVLVP